MPSIVSLMAVCETSRELEIRQEGGDQSAQAEARQLFRKLIVVKRVEVKGEEPGSEGRRKGKAS